MDTEFDTDKREAHARAMLQKMNLINDPEKQRLWRWALRGIVIQWIKPKQKKVLVEWNTFFF